MEGIRRRKCERKKGWKDGGGKREQGWKKEEVKGGIRGRKYEERKGRRRKEKREKGSEEKNSAEIRNI